MLTTLCHFPAARMGATIRNRSQGGTLVTYSVEQTTSERKFLRLIWGARPTSKLWWEALWRHLSSWLRWSLQPWKWFNSLLDTTLRSVFLLVWAMFKLTTKLTSMISILEWHSLLKASQIERERRTLVMSNTSRESGTKKTEKCSIGIFPCTNVQNKTTHSFIPSTKVLRRNITP